ncbi:MAG: bifunctional nuclease family protein [Planctomycetes bacterium]|nr:bifunctional nuclease family protein [Planctomycetota bacterium]
MDIEVELSKIIINEASSQQIIVLKERNGRRSFPIVIGISEIVAIDRRLKGLIPPRPMTHDLLANVIERIGGKIEKIVINDLREHTFYAQIHLNVNGRGIKIDSRPSDAIAVSVASDVPVFVAEHIFESL